MATVLFTVLPAMGHINPTLPVAVELKSRGHRVAYATGTDFQDAIKAAGVEYFPAGPPGLSGKMTPAAEKMLKHTGLRSHYYFFQLLAENNEEMIRDGRGVMDRVRPDVIVTDSLTHAGAQLADLVDIPWATFCSVPGLIPSRDVPPFTTWGLPPSRNPVIRAGYSAVRTGQKVFFSLFDRRFNTIRASVGLPPVRQSAINSALSPYLILCPTCDGFEYPRTDWPPHTHLIGPAPWGKADNAADAFSWIMEQPRDRQLIYVTLGTVQVFRSLEFFSIVIEALKDVRCRAVLSVGRSVDPGSFNGAPAHFRFEQFVPHDLILPRADAVIHHGGQGIAQDCIYHGIPSVVVPISQDLFEVARRCDVAGVSVRIPYKKLTVSGLKQAVDRALRDSRLRENTGRLQEVFRRTHAARTGAELIERLINTSKPVYRQSRAEN